MSRSSGEKPSAGTSAADRKYPVQSRLRNIWLYARYFFSSEGAFL